MTVQELVKIGIETFAKNINIPVNSIKVLSVEEGNHIINAPKPGQMSTQQLSKIVKCLVFVNGRKYLLTIPRSGRGKIKWTGIK